MTPDIRPLVAGNWKMNGTRENLSELKAIAEGLGAELADAIDALICPPATLIYVATAVADETPLSIGAQDCHDKKSGAYTGDISAEMIADCLAGYVLVGHSERRTLHGEEQRDRPRQGRGCESCRADPCHLHRRDRGRAQGWRDAAVLGQQLAGSVPDGATAKPTPSLPMSRSGRSAPA
jgi:triosephosphate isomerase